MSKKTITVHGGYDDFLEALDEIKKNQEEKTPLQLFLIRVEKQIDELQKHAITTQKQIGELQEYVLKFEERIWELEDQQT